MAGGTKMNEQNCTGSNTKKNSKMADEELYKI